MGIREEWDDFARGIPDNAPPREIEIMRRGYYLGAHTLFCLLHEAGNHTPAERERKVRELVADMESHATLMELLDRCFGDE